MNTNRPTDFKSLSAQRQVRDRDRRAFTLTELLVVLVTLGILATLLLPALANTQPGSTKAFQCLNNMRQLGLAWLLYSNDNHDRLVTNADGNNTPVATRNWICPAVGGSPITLDWTASPKNTNTVYLIIDQNVLGVRCIALMGNYVGKSIKIFLCPADNNLSTIQRALGWQNRIRSCAMNGAMGDGSKWFALPVGNPLWPQFYNVKKMSDMHSPGPADCWVIMDEHPDSDDDATFYVNPAAANGTGTSFEELPGSMHGNAAGLVYADGHSDLHKWTGSVTTQPFNANFTSYLQAVPVGGDAASKNDLTWLAQHTPAN
jgi:prepilin-type N-terminal cleavage/methylation domain-containing protein